MIKSLSDRIAERMSTRKLTRSGKNRAHFLAVRNEVKQAIDDGWPIKAIWATLHDEGKITFGYDAFISYVNRLIRSDTDAIPSNSHSKTTKPKPKAKSNPPTHNPMTRPPEISVFKYNPNMDAKDLL